MKASDGTGIETQVLDSLKECIEEFRLSLVVLFGSRVSGSDRPGSDIDIAVYRDGMLSSGEELSLFDRICRSTQGPFDLVVLNRADPLLHYQVASTGKPIYQRTGREFQMLQVRAVQRMNDARKFLDLERNYIDRFLQGVRPRARR